ncbi:uncharacterized protein LOC135473696 [Liolophura sinensis]|uniref:uncharacterized protein LOC135473696 n=1 Tax=Liolophura sinensis TaxID=3198878 RepID=UPI0031587B4D
MSELQKSQDYQSFRSTISQKKIVVDDDGKKVWTLYDAGPRHIRCPLICFPPASGTADVFYRQIMALSTVGFRVISVEYPVYWTLKEFCEGFRRFLDHLQLDRVHIFGASLGGFLAQKFAEYTSRSPRIASLILCNAFSDTTIFQQTTSAATFWMMPALILKKMVMGNFERGFVDADIADSVDFLVDKLDGLTQQELASRLTLNCMNAYVEPQKLKELDITLMDVFDECALSHQVKEEMYKCYPDARRAHLKSGGNFPYLSRSDEVNIYIQIHLQKYEGGKYSAKDAPKVDECREAHSSQEVWQYMGLLVLQGVAVHGSVVLQGVAVHGSVVLQGVAVHGSVVVQGVAVHGSVVVQGVAVHGVWQYMGLLFCWVGQYMGLLFCMMWQYMGLLFCRVWQYMGLLFCRVWQYKGLLFCWVLQYMATRHSSFAVERPMSHNRSQFCCCGRRVFNLQRIAPLNDSQDNYLFLEVRPKRWLNICHLNARSRDDQFSRELLLAAQGTNNGFPVIRCAKVVPSPVHTSQRVQEAPALSDTMGSNRVQMHLNTPESVKARVHFDSSIGGDDKAASRFIDATVDRGHSAASVALSLASHQSSAPSPHAQLPSSKTEKHSCESQKESESVKLEISTSNSPSKPKSSQQGEKEAVLFFFHGVGGSSDTWRAQIDYFSAQGYEVVAPDLLGHGFSGAPDKRKAYHFEEITKDLEAVFDKFCKKRNVIIAHSYGCSFAVVLARKRSRRVTKIVLISGGGPTPLAPQPGVFSLPFCLLVCVRPCLDCGFQQSAFHKSRRVHSPKDQAFDIPTYVLRHMMNGQRWLEGDRVFHNWLSVATLLIYGKHDKLVTLEEERTMEKTIYGSRLEVVDGASHMVMMEQPQAVNSLIHNFLLSDFMIAGQS